MSLFCSIALLFLATGSTRADLWVPSIFRDNMVLQSDRSAPVWGEADTGAEITVAFAGQEKKTTADGNGKWKILLDPMPVSSTPRTLNVCSSVKNQKLEIKNVLVGEVWILAGQSNMGWALSKCDGGNEAAAEANYSWLRIFRQWPYQGVADEPARDVTGGNWTVCSPDIAKDLSGVGFFFARELQKALPPGTPIALINTQMGATYAECWIDRQTLENTPSAQPFIQRAKTEMEAGNEGPGTFLGEMMCRRPSAFYNGKVAPIQPFAVRGTIWYQGEGNSAPWLASGYAETMKALVTSWRQKWPDLPFLIVQLPRFNSGSEWPAIRAAQEKTARDLAGVELIVTIDHGQKDTIHPSDKQPVGERLALMARAKVYGENIACEGPFFQSLEMSNGAAYLTFSNSEGLHLKGSEGFEIRSAEGAFVAAEVEVLKDGRVKVFSPGVTEPSAVRYAWFNWGEVCLFNGLGLPAAPFTKMKD
jgi:sialate O-acetylesterase